MQWRQHGRSLRRGRYVLMVAGLARLEHLYSVANAEDSPIEIDAVRVDDVTQCYMALRQLDSRNSASRKFIILDLSNNYAVRTVLKQVTVYLFLFRHANYNLLSCMHN